MEIAICDDCLDTIGSLEEIVSECFHSTDDFNCDSYMSGEELWAVIEGNEKKYQVYLLDIEMRELDGLELAKRIRTENLSSAIIFITNHNELMQSVFEVNAFHFLVKPLNYEKAKQIILKAIFSLHVGKLVFQYKIRKAVYSIFYEQILLFESYKRKITIYTEKEKLEFYGSLNDIIYEVNTQVFAQVHKSYIVNMNYIKYMEREAIVMYNDIKICVTKKYHKSFNEAYKNFILMRM